MIPRRTLHPPRTGVLECGAPAPRFLFPALLLILLLAAGCRSTPSASNSPIDQLHLLVTSVALNLDDKPGPDGVGVRVYASRKGEAQALPITSGALDILMYDGNLPLNELPAREPLRTWSYPAAKLKPQLQETSIGTSYRFAAVWGDDKPKGDRVTLVARYTSPSGQVVYSAPSSVPLSLD